MYDNSNFTKPSAGPRGCAGSHRVIDPAPLRALSNHPVCRTPSPSSLPQRRDSVTQRGPRAAGPRLASGAPTPLGHLASLDAPAPRGTGAALDPGATPGKPGGRAALSRRVNNHTRTSMTPAGGLNATFCHVRGGVGCPRQSAAGIDHGCRKRFDMRSAPRMAQGRRGCH